MNTKSRGLSRKTVKQIMYQECGNKVSTESVDYLMILLTNQLKDICQDVKIQFEEDNKLREFHHLPKRKMIDVRLFKSLVVENILTPPELEGLSEVGHNTNRETTLQKADEYIEVT